MCVCILTKITCVLGVLQVNAKCVAYRYAKNTMLNKPFENTNCFQETEREYLQITQNSNQPCPKYWQNEEIPMQKKKHEEKKIPLLDEIDANFLPLCSDLQSF